ncbi:hypothetical protein N7453_001420 [Penicillium expansum]|nr:hypothetical protein N7453_001420 [Penicillium expansum]
MQALSAVVQELDDLAGNRHRQKARVVIQGELDGNEHMDRERKAILKSALQFVDVTWQRRTSIADKSSPLEVSHEDFQHSGPFIAPSPELLYMLLPEPTTAEGRASCVQWPDHISDKTLEKMASTILSDDGYEHGQVFYQYCICVYVKAIFHLYQKPRAYKDPRINAQFLKSKKLYETYAFRALKSLNFLNAPTLPFVQSLISAAFLMQYLGNMNQCWILNSYAARLITALGYHEICNPLGNSSLDEEIHSASRASAPECIASDWISCEFCYYAILVDILRSRLKCSFSPLTHKECVSYSRKSLRALHHLQKNLADTLGFVDPYPTFLTWTVLLYPLSPFFVLFCNIIGELDMEDYTLLQDITQSLSQFAASPYISKLLKLLDYLQNLCVPLIQAKQRMGPQAKVPTLYPSMTGTWHDHPSSTNEHANLMMAGSPYMDITGAYPQQLQTPSDGSYAPDNSLMWQLFNSHVSLEWFDDPFSY